LFLVAILLNFARYIELLCPKGFRQLYFRDMFKNRVIFDAIFISLILFASTWQIFLGIGCLKWDTADIYLPWKHFVTECLRNGILPLWNPFMNSGFVQYGDPGTWYPVSWFIGLFGRYDQSSVHAEYLLHLYIAGLGMYVWWMHLGLSRATRIIVAVSYMLSGLFIGQAQHLGWLVAAAWLPYIFMLFSKTRSKPTFRNAIVLAFLLFLLLSGGYPAFFIVTSYVLLGLFLYYVFLACRAKTYSSLLQWLKALSFSVFCFACFSLVVLVSSFDISAYINRGVPLSLDAPVWNVFAGAFTPNSLLSFIVPFATGKDIASFWGLNNTLLNVYIGVITLCAAVLSWSDKSLVKKTWPYLFWGILFLATAMAKVFPLRRWSLVLPYFGMFRLATLFRVYAMLFFVVSSGYFFDRLWGDSRVKKRFGLVALASSLLLSGYVYYFWRKIEPGFLRKLFSSDWMHFLADSTFAERYVLQGCFFVFFLLIVFLLGKYWGNARFYKKIVVALVCCEMVLSTQMLIYDTAISNAVTATRVDQAIALQPAGYPLPDISKPQSSFSDYALSSRIPFLWKNISAYCKTPTFDGNSPYGFLNVRDAISAGLYDIVEKNPLLYCADSISLSGIIDTLSVCWSGEGTLLDVTDFNPNKIDVSVVLDRPSNLVFAQNYYPYWTATVDDVEQEIQLVNKALMAISVPQGSHDVAFVFSSKSVRLSAWISICSWIIFAIFIVATEGRRRLLNKKNDMHGNAILKKVQEN